MANYPEEFVCDAAYQRHTSRLTELWSLPRPAQGLNTYNNNNPSVCEIFYGIPLYRVDYSDGLPRLLGFEFGRTCISFISVLYQHFSLLVFKIGWWSILNQVTLVCSLFCSFLPCHFGG